MDIRSRSCNQYAVLSLRFEKDSSCNTSRDRWPLDIFDMLFCAVKCDFLRG